MKKMYIALMLVIAMLFTASVCFAEDFDYVPQYIDLCVTLNGEEINLRDDCYLRAGDEVTVKVTSLNDDDISYVYVSHCDKDDQFEYIDLLAVEEINSKTYEATVTIDENEVGTKRMLTVDAGLVGEYSDDTCIMSFYNATWMPGENTVGSTDTTSKAYSYVMFEDSILSVNALNTLKPASIITIGDTIESENPDYIFEDYTIDLNGYTFTTANIETAIEMPDTASNNLYTLRVFTRYHLASDESVKMVCWKTYSIVLAE